MRSYSSNVILEIAKQHYENNEYYKALVEYENYVILKPESKDDYTETIKKIRIFPFQLNLLQHFKNYRWFKTGLFVISCN